MGSLSPLVKRKNRGTKHLKRRIRVTWTSVETRVTTEGASSELSVPCPVSPRLVGESVMSGGSGSGKTVVSLKPI